MAFQKGHKFSTGRQHGAKGKKTAQWDIFADWFLTGGLQRLEEEMKKLDGKDFIITVKDLMEYFQPKLSRSEVTNTHNFQQIESIEQALRAYVAAKRGTNGLGEARLQDALPGRNGQTDGANGRTGDVVLPGLLTPPPA